MRRALTPLAMGLAVATALLPWEVEAAPADSSILVYDGPVNVRSAPSLAAPPIGRLEQGAIAPVAGTVNGEAVEGNSKWFRLAAGGFVAGAVVSGTPPGEGAAAAAEAAAKERGARLKGRRWIDVNLAALEARAMVGDQVIYRAQTVSGRPDWETPAGNFRVLRKKELTTMSSASFGLAVDAPGGYSQPNVPWVLYFTDYGHALHGNDYVPGDYFGRVRSSHGCVGMRVADARFFYDFAPVGTPVVVHW